MANLFPTGFTLGQEIQVPGTFVNAAGTPYNPTVVTYTYWTEGVAEQSVFTPNSSITNPATGSFVLSYEPPQTGDWYFSISGDGTAAQEWIVSVNPSFATPNATGWPNGFGYCKISDITARVLGGQWNPDLANQWPGKGQVNQWISEVSSLMDSVLAKRGYQLPLTVIPGFPGGQILPQAYFILQNICAAYVTNHVEQARHGSVEENKDSNADAWLQYADDLMLRLSTGDDDLIAWGVYGTFEPELDPSSGLQLGSMIDPVSGDTTEPLFSRESMSSF